MLSDEPAREVGLRRGASMLWRVLSVSLGLMLVLGYASPVHAEGRGFTFPVAQIRVDVPNGWGWNTGNDGTVSFFDASKEFLVMAQTMDGANMAAAVAAV